MVVSFIFTNHHSFKKEAMCVIMAIVICQIHVQAVEYILDDQTINSEQVCGRIVHLH